MRCISRRDMLKIGGLAAAGAVGTGALAGCGSKASAANSTFGATDVETGNYTTSAGHLRIGLPSFLAKPDPITDVKATYDYDVVVIGAGAPGVPCALKACEEGAHVALVQKENVASAHGNSGSGIDLDNSNPADVANLVSVLMAESQYRPNRKLIEMWAYNSGEAVSWVIDRATKAGAQIVDQGNAQHIPMIKKFGYTMNMVTSYFGPKPYCVGDGMQALAEYAEEQGVDVYYSTPAQQLVQDSTGKVTGVVCVDDDDGGYIQFNAKNGVVIATGDYQNDEDMLRYYLPDMTNFTQKQLGRTGDGHKMVVWAGGAIEPIGHTKMLHDFDAAPASMCNMPFLRMKLSGERFCREDEDMSIMNCYLRSEEDQGNYVYVFDSEYMTKAAEFPGTLVDPEGLRQYMPAEDVEHKGVFKDQINTWKADTLEELARKLEVRDVDQFVKTVKRFNELCEAGEDVDFGLDPKYLKKIDTPPYYGAHLWVRMSSICAGVKVNDELQCVTPEGEPIGNLYAIGNAAGGFYGGIDYPLTVFGVNLGRLYTQGYLVGQKLGRM